MIVQRALRYLNILIGVAAVFAAAAVYWFAFRPLPKTSGEIAAPVSARATIARDGLGVPHIEAASVEDALLLQGFVTAQDRMWQMDALRRLAGGEVAEIAGERGLKSDREARTLRLRRLAEAHAAALEREDRRWLAAYARGVNHYLETHRGRLPVEFTLLGYDPRPWTIADSIAIGLQMFRTLSTTWESELRKAAILSSGDARKVARLFPERLGTEPSPGSNAWALSGAWTAGGKPLLASDPHLEFSMPSTWYLAHLKGGELDVAGATLPGLPAVIIGHNRRIAWGMTNLHFDVEDLYLEQFNPRTGSYAAAGAVRQAALETEWIPVKGGKPMLLRNWVTRHGPIVVSEGGRHLALRWVAAEPGIFRFAFVDLNLARNWQEFRNALSRSPGPAQNVVYADIEGNIGYQAMGRLPVRAYDGSVPADGAAGAFEWRGFIPFEELPSVFNPPSGMIVSANENPFPESYPYRVSGSFTAPYRTRQIRALLGAKKNWKAEELLAVQKDVYSAFSHFLAGQAVAACERRGAANPELREAVALLREWNGQMEKDQAAPFLAALLFQQVRRGVVESATNGKPQVYETRMASGVIEALLRERPPGWFDDYDAFLVRALADAAGQGRRLQGRDPRRWSYGAYNRLNLAHPVGSQLPLLGRYFAVGAVPMSGSSTTVKQTTPRLGPSMRMIADPGDWDRSLQNITTGQSGHVLSKHFKDQWTAYYEGRSFPMRFSRIEPAGTLVVTPAP